MYFSFSFQAASWRSMLLKCMTLSFPRCNEFVNAAESDVVARDNRVSFVFRPSLDSRPQPNVYFIDQLRKPSASAHLNPLRKLDSISRSMRRQKNGKIKRRWSAIAVNVMFAIRQSERFRNAIGTRMTALSLLRYCLCTFQLTFLPLDTRRRGGEKSIRAFASINVETQPMHFRKFYSMLTLMPVITKFSIYNSRFLLSLLEKCLCIIHYRDDSFSQISSYNELREQKHIFIGCKQSVFLFRIWFLRSALWIIHIIGEREAAIPRNQRHTHCAERLANKQWLFSSF